VTYVEAREGASGRQVNIRLRDGVLPGQYELTLRFGNAVAEAASFEVV
jgi:hypothetical protein